MHFKKVISKYASRVPVLLISALVLAGCASSPSATTYRDGKTGDLSPAQTMNVAVSLATEQRYGDAIDLLSELLVTTPLSAVEAAQARQLRGELYLNSPDCMIELASDDLAYVADGNALPADQIQDAQMVLADIESQGATLCTINSTAPLKTSTPVFERSCYASLRGSGTITLGFDVDATGTPENISVRNATDECMNGPAIRALGAMQFEPRIVNGRQVKREGMEVTFNASN